MVSESPSHLFVCGLREFLENQECRVFKDSP